MEGANAEDDGEACTENQIRLFLSKKIKDNPCGFPRLLTMDAKKTLLELVRRDGNRTCADCSSPSPQWASGTLSPLPSRPSPSPSSLLRRLPLPPMRRRPQRLRRAHQVVPVLAPAPLLTPISFVRSVSMDTWQDDQLRRMQVRIAFSSRIPTHPCPARRKCPLQSVHPVLLSPRAGSDGPTDAVPLLGRHPVPRKGASFHRFPSLDLSHPSWTMPWLESPGRPPVPLPTRRQPPLFRRVLHPLRVSASLVLLRAVRPPAMLQLVTLLPMHPKRPQMKPTLPRLVKRMPLAPPTCPLPKVAVIKVSAAPPLLHRHSTPLLASPPPPPHR